MDLNLNQKWAFVLTAIQRAVKSGPDSTDAASGAILRSPFPWSLDGVHLRVAWITAEFEDSQAEIVDDHPTFRKKAFDFLTSEMIPQNEKGTNGILALFIVGKPQMLLTFSTLGSL